MKLRVAVLLIGTLSVAASASAADRKAFHGGRCQYNINFNAGLERDSVTGVHAAEAVQVNCPLIRDRLQTSTSLNSITLEGTNSGGDYFCTLFSQTEDGTSGGQVDFDSFVVDDVGRLSESLDVDSTAGNEGTYTVVCILPKHSTVNHIYMSEDDTSAVD